MTPLEPRDGAHVLRDREVVFRVAADPGAVRVMVEIHADRSGDDVIVGVTSAHFDGEAWVARTTVDDLVWNRPGSYRWRAVADGVEGPLLRIEVEVPAAARRRSPIPLRFGRRREGGTLLLYRRGIPEGVSRSRFRFLASVSAKRWGLRIGGWTTRRPGRTDGVSVLGFSRRVSASALGANRRIVERRYRIGSRGRRVLVSRRVVDTDVLLRMGVPWFGGPGYPDLGSFDLESVLLHELGHFAGNLGHRRRCSGTPLDAAGAAGEWWRTPRDWFAFCEARVQPPK